MYAPSPAPKITTSARACSSIAAAAMAAATTASPATSPARSTRRVWPVSAMPSRR